MFKTKGLPEVYAFSKPVPVRGTEFPFAPHVIPYGIGDTIATPAVHATVAETELVVVEVLKIGEVLVFEVDVVGSDVVVLG